MNFVVAVVDADGGCKKRQFARRMGRHERISDILSVFFIKVRLCNHPFISMSSILCGRRMCQVHPHNKQALMASAVKATDLRQELSGLSRIFAIAPQQGSVFFS
jgi:hypothetical protein